MRHRFWEWSKWVCYYEYRLGRLIGHGSQWSFLSRRSHTMYAGHAAYEAAGYRDGMYLTW